MPKNWNWLKFDAKNIKAIHKRFGSKKIKTHKLISLERFIYYKFLKRIEWVPFLDYFLPEKRSSIEIEADVNYRHIHINIMNPFLRDFIKDIFF